MITSRSRLREGCVVIGSLFNEPMRVETVRASGDGTWTVGLVGTQSERFRKVTLTDSDINTLTILDSAFSYDGDGRLAQAENRHAELLARRQRRRQELEHQRSLSLQAVERITSVLILPHPERKAPEVQQLRQNLETEAIAMQVVMDHERNQGRQVYDVHEKNLG